MHNVKSFKNGWSMDKTENYEVSNKVPIADLSDEKVERAHSHDHVHYCWW